MRPPRPAGAGTFIPLVVIAGHVAAGGVFVSHVITIMCNPSLRWSTERNHRILLDNSLTAFRHQQMIYTFIHISTIRNETQDQDMSKSLNICHFSHSAGECGLCGGLLWM